MYQIRQNYVFFIEKGFLIFPTYYSLRAIYYVFQINYFQMLWLFHSYNMKTLEKLLKKSYPVKLNKDC